MGRKNTKVKEIKPIRKKKNKSPLSEIKDEKNDFLAFTKMVNDMIISYDPSKIS